MQAERDWRHSAFAAAVAGARRCAAAQPHLSHHTQHRCSAHISCHLLGTTRPHGAGVEWEPLSSVHLLAFFAPPLLLNPSIIMAAPGAAAADTATAISDEEECKQFIRQRLQALVAEVEKAYASTLNGSEEARSWLSSQIVQFASELRKCDGAEKAVNRGKQTVIHGSKIIVAAPRKQSASQEKQVSAQEREEKDSIASYTSDIDVLMCFHLCFALLSAAVHSGGSPAGVTAPRRRASLLPRTASSAIFRLSTIVVNTPRSRAALASSCCSVSRSTRVTRATRPIRRPSSSTATSLPPSCHSSRITTCGRCVCPR